eukprot:gene5671-6548_t
MIATKSQPAPFEPAFSIQQHTPTVSSPLSLLTEADLEEDDEGDSLGSSTNDLSPPRNSSSNDADSAIKRKRRPRAPAPFLDSLFCHSCGETQTSQWRRGPDGCKSLCNACGIRFANIVNKEKALIVKEKTISINMLLNDSQSQSESHSSHIVEAFPMTSPIIPAVASNTIPQAAAAKSMPFFSNSKLSYAPPPPPSKKSSPVQSSSSINKRKTTTSASPIQKSHKAYHGFEQSSMDLQQQQQQFTYQQNNSFNFSSFPLDALSTIATSEALMIAQQD